MFTVRVNDDYLLALLHRDLPVSVRLVTVGHLPSLLTGS
jgi:hypothetical protein